MIYIREKVHYLNKAFQLLKSVQSRPDTSYV